METPVEEMTSTKSSQKMSYLYWFTSEQFEAAKASLKAEGYSLAATLLTPCQVMRAKGKKLIYAPPAVWSRMCGRQGSWYRTSEKAGKTMLMSEERLSESFDENLDAILEESDFQPKALPPKTELQRLAEAPAYQRAKPEAWEKVGWWEHAMLKAFFGLFRFWKRGETLKSEWLSHRANHANFVAKEITTEIEGEQVPYTLTENKGVCSSCAEFFNVVSPESRKLVRSCPGSIVFGGAPRESYVDVRVQKHSA